MFVYQKNVFGSPVRDQYIQVVMKSNKGVMTLQVMLLGPMSSP